MAEKFFHTFTEGAMAAARSTGVLFITSGMGLVAAICWPFFTNALPHRDSTQSNPFFKTSLRFAFNLTTSIHFYVNKKLFDLFSTFWVIKTDKSASQHPHPDTHNLTRTKVPMHLRRFLK